MNLHRVALATLVLAACAEGPQPGCPGEVAVEPGSAPSDDPETFVPLRDGDVVELVFGAQGGVHVWQSARATGVGRDCRVSRHVERVDDGLVLFDNEPGDRFELLSDGGGCRTPFAEPSFVCARDALDHDVYLEVGVDDGTATASGRVRVHVVCSAEGCLDEKAGCE